jgi:hypothetical protein
LDTTSFTSLIVQPSVLATLAMIALLICAALWIASRSGSMHLVRLRAWRLVHGKAELADAEISALADSTTCLVSFRFLTGLRKVRTLKRAHRLIEWMSLHDEDFDSVRRCGDLFDLEALRVHRDRLLGLRKKLALFATWMLLVIAAAVAGNAIALSGALLKIKESRTWLVAYSDHASLLSRIWGHEGGSLERDACAGSRERVPTVSGFTTKEAAIICELFDDPEWKEHIHKNVRDQRFSFLLFALVFLVVSFMPFMPLVRNTAAKQLLGRLEDKKGD